MTFILNVLHEDMSILAADKRAVAELPSIWGAGFPSRGEAVCHDFKKISLNSNCSLAIATSGYSEHNFYIGEVEGSESVNEGLLIIRNHMGRFLRIDDRASLIKIASPFENECIATFYDAETETFFTNEFGFNEFSNRTRLHRAVDEVKVFAAGSGRVNFDLTSAIDEVRFLAGKCDESELQGILISWMSEAFKKVSIKNQECGAEAMFAVATRMNHVFHLK